MPHIPYTPLAGKSICALVIEGGGMRGAFSAGVLDIFLEQRFDPFSVYGGTSGGAMNLSSFLSGQHGRNFRIYRDICTSPQFVSARKYFRGGHWVDLDWLWQQMAAHEPFDVTAACSHTRNKHVYFAATRIDTGAPVYLRPDREIWMDQLKASAALPVLYRHFVTVGGHAYTDGGVADPLPTEYAEMLGAKVVVVIRSRPQDYRIRSRWTYQLAAAVPFRRYPQLRSALKSHVDIYNRQADLLQQRAGQHSLWMIAPQQATAAGRTSISRASIEEDYRRGRAAGTAFLHAHGEQLT